MQVLAMHGNNEFEKVAFSMLVVAAPLTLADAPSSSS